MSTQTPVIRTPSNLVALVGNARIVRITYDGVRFTTTSNGGLHFLPGVTQASIMIETDTGLALNAITTLSPSSFHTDVSFQLYFRYGIIQGNPNGFHVLGMGITSGFESAIK